MDKDLTAVLLAQAVGAHVLLLNDVEAVIDGFGTPRRRQFLHGTAGTIVVPGVGEREGAGAPGYNPLLGRQV